MLPGRLALLFSAVSPTKVAIAPLLIPSLMSVPNSVPYVIGSLATGTPQGASFAVSVLLVWAITAYFSVRLWANPSRRLIGWVVLFLIFLDLWAYTTMRELSWNVVLPHGAAIVLLAYAALAEPRVTQADSRPKDFASQTFYEQQAANRRTTLLLVIVVGGSLFISVYVVLAVVGLADIARFAGPFAWGFALGTYELGDVLVLWASRARPARAAEQRQLLNVVREMSVAANIPMPSVYVIDDKAGNALAFGRDARHVSLAVTTGLLKMLNHEELQGVVAHEVAHIRTLDTRLGLAVVVFLIGVPFFWDVLRVSRRRAVMARTDAKGSRLRRNISLVVPVAWFMLAGVTFLLAIFAPLFALAIRFAIGKEREYLADATAVALTRNAYGLERALSKLARDRAAPRAPNRALRYLYFVDPLRSAHGRTFLPDIHPAIDDRTARLRRLTTRIALEDRRSD